MDRVFAGAANCGGTRRHGLGGVNIGLVARLAPQARGRSLQEGCDGRGEKIPKIGDLNVGGMRRGELGDGHVRYAEDGGEGPQCPWGAVQGPGRG